MTARKPFKSLTQNWGPDRKARVAAKTRAMDQELDLSAVREALGITQDDLASALGRSQGAVSQMENRTDMTVSNLRRVIEAMGGKLKVSAEFPDKTVALGIGSPTQTP